MAFRYGPRNLGPEQMTAQELLRLRLQKQLPQEEVVLTRTDTNPAYRRPTGTPAPTGTSAASSGTTGTALNSTTQLPTTAGPAGGAAYSTKPLTEVKPVAVDPAPAGTAQPAGAIIQPRPLSPRAEALLAKLESLLSAAPVTGEQIVASPEFQAQAAIIEQRRAAAQAANRRSFASRNMLRGTPAIQALTQTEQEWDIEAGRLVPQLMSTAYARRQDEIAQNRNQLNAILGAEQQAFGQGQADFNAGLAQAGVTGTYQGQPTFSRLVTEAGLTGNYQGQPTLAGRSTVAGLTGVDPATGQPTFSSRVTEAGLTGRYMPPEATRLIDTILTAKRGSVGVPDARNAANMAAAQAARAQLWQYGIDPSLFGADVTLEQAIANAAKVGYTMSGRTTEAGFTGIDPATGTETPEAKYRRLQGEREQLLAEIAEYDRVIKESQAENVKQVAKIELQTKQKELEKVVAEIEATKALTRQRDRSNTNTEPSLAQQRNEIRGLITQAKAQGKTYEQTVQAIRDNAGELGAVSLQDALEEAALIYGVTKPSPSDTSTAAANTFTAQLLELKGRGRTYTQAKQALDDMVTAGDLKNLTYSQAVSILDRVYGNAKYDE